MTDYTVKPLGRDTWDAFARLVERHNGVFGGCWCTWFHTFHAEKTFTYEGNRALKERLVKNGRAHAALVVQVNAALRRYIADGSWKRSLERNIAPSGYSLPAPPTPGT